MFEAKFMVIPIGSQFKVWVKRKQPTLEAKTMEEIPYASAVVSLVYAIVWSRPDSVYEVGLVGGFMENTRTSHGKQWNGLWGT